MVMHQNSQLGVVGRYEQASHSYTPNKVSKGGDVHSYNHLFQKVITSTRQQAVHSRLTPVPKLGSGMPLVPRNHLQRYLRSNVLHNT